VCKSWMSTSQLMRGCHREGMNGLFGTYKRWSDGFLIPTQFAEIQRLTVDGDVHFESAADSSRDPCTMSLLAGNKTLISGIQCRIEVVVTFRPDRHPCSMLPELSSAPA